MKFLITYLGLTLVFTACQPASEAPAIRVLDTDFSKGRLGHEQRLSLGDLEKFHGHRCDGLVMGYLALQLGLAELYGQEPVDRTDLRIVSPPSPCLADAAIYLTGGRYQYGSFYIDAAIPGLFALQRLSDSSTYFIALREGVKPASIDSLGALALEGQLSPCLIDSLRQLEDDFSAYMLKTKAEELFEIRPAPHFVWAPRRKNDYRKSDVLNKDLPPCRP